MSYNEGLQIIYSQINDEVYTHQELIKKYETEQNKEQKLELKKAELEGSLEGLLQTEGIEIPEKPSYYTWLTTGLSFMLFVGISELLGIHFDDLKAEQTFIIIISLIAAICLTLGVKLAIIPQAKAFLNYRPKGTLKLANNSLWEKIQNGELAIFFSFSTWIGETSLATPGLVRLLPHQLQSDLIFQGSMFAAAGFAALVNVAMAWGIAKEEIQVEKKQKEPSYVEFKERIQFLCREIAAVESQLSNTTRNVEDLRKRALKVEQRVTKLYSQWISGVEQWSQENPHETEKGKEIYAKDDHLRQQMNLSHISHINE